MVDKIKKICYYLTIVICIIFFMLAMYAGFQNLENHLQEINYVEIVNGGF